MMTAKEYWPIWAGKSLFEAEGLPRKTAITFAEAYHKAVQPDLQLLEDALFMAAAVDGDPARAAKMREAGERIYQLKQGEVMQPHQERVVAEKKELDEKREKLGAFIEGKIFQTLPPEERNRLEQQAIAMTTYSTILGERIAAF
jgi:hypothetical protein